MQIFLQFQTLTLLVELILYIHLHLQTTYWLHHLYLKLLSRALLYNMVLKRLKEIQLLIIR